MLRFWFKACNKAVNSWRDFWWIFLCYSFIACFPFKKFQNTILLRILILYILHGNFGIVQTNFENCMAKECSPSWWRLCHLHTHTGIMTSFWVHVAPESQAKYTTYSSDWFVTKNNKTSLCYFRICQVLKVAVNLIKLQKMKSWMKKTEDVPFSFILNFLSSLDPSTLKFCNKMVIAFSKFLNLEQTWVI